MTAGRPPFAIVCHERDHAAIRGRAGSTYRLAGATAGPGSVAAPGRGEQAGDLCHGRVAGPDVTHDGARGLVAGLGHDQLERDLLVAEVGGRRVAELVQLQAVAAAGGGVLL